ncbi:hypothetical protein GCM10025861_25590 [Methanobacterium petrolearium]|nr:hypothetical protein GCM10025861_25590 [Methanobacterium petrolearium]
MTCYTTNVCFYYTNGGFHTFTPLKNHELLKQHYSECCKRAVRDNEYKPVILMRTSLETDLNCLTNPFLLMNYDEVDI